MDTRTYVILTEKRKSTSAPTGLSYYSHVFGCFSSREQAMRFRNFEAALPKVRKLRAAAPEWFFHAVRL